MSIFDRVGAGVRYYKSKTEARRLFVRTQVLIQSDRKGQARCPVAGARAYHSESHSSILLAISRSYSTDIFPSLVTLLYVCLATYYSNAYKDDDSLISILRSYFPSLRSNRQFTRSGWVSLTLIAILVVREFSRSNPVQHGDIGRSPSLESLSERTFTQGYPLLKKTAESQDLPVWQTARETDASGKEGQRRNPLEPKEMLKIGQCETQPSLLPSSSLLWLRSAFLA